MFSRTFFNVVRSWQKEKKFGCLVSQRGERPQAFFPLRDDKDVVYQIVIYGRCLCLRPQIYVSEYTSERGAVIVSNQRVIISYLFWLRQDLDSAVATISTWMSKHGAEALRENIHREPA